jgi:CBS domain containing-hemolysin-like protein
MKTRERRAVREMKEKRPFGVTLWEEASNCHKLLRVKSSSVVNVMVKRRDIDHVMWGLER